jgi:hypothetical protein
MTTIIPHQPHLRLPQEEASEEREVPMQPRQYPWFLAFIVTCAVWGGQAADVAAVLPQVEMCLVATPPQDCDAIAPVEVELGPGEVTSVEVIVQINSVTCHAVPTDGQATPCPTEATLSLQGNLPVGISACLPAWNPNEQLFDCLPLPQVVPLPTSVSLILGAIAAEATTPNTSSVQPGTTEITVCADFINGTESGEACDPLHLIVHPFSLVPSGNIVTLQPGESTTMPLQIVRTEGFDDDIELQEVLSVLGQGITLLYDPNPVTSTDLATVLHIGAGAAADQGTYTVAVSGTGGGVTRSVPMTVQVKSCRKIKIGSFEICK